MSLAVRLIGIAIAGYLALGGLATWGQGGPGNATYHNTAIVVWVIALAIYLGSDRIAKRLGRKKE